MAFHEIVAPTVKALFIQQIEGMILSGELRPGDRLPTERELADEMKISKTVVHEGLRELHRLGVLDIASPPGGPGGGQPGAAAPATSSAPRRSTSTSSPG